MPPPLPVTTRSSRISAPALHEGDRLSFLVADLAWKDEGWKDWIIDSIVMERRMDDGDVDSDDAACLFLIIVG